MGNKRTADKRNEKKSDAVGRPVRTSTRVRTKKDTSTPEPPKTRPKPIPRFTLKLSQPKPPTIQEATDPDILAATQGLLGLASGAPLGDGDLPEQKESDVEILGGGHSTDKDGSSEEKGSKRSDSMEEDEDEHSSESMTEGMRNLNL
jgi:hypothetical protein